MSKTACFIGALEALLPNPRRKKIGNAIAAAMFGYGDKIPNEVFDKIVNAVMAVEP